MLHITSGAVTTRSVLLYSHRKMFRRRYDICLLTGASLLAPVALVPDCIVQFTCVGGVSVY
jgi:hypothetical protein